MDNSELCVVNSDSTECPTANNNNTFVISEALTSQSPQRVEEIIDIILSAEIETNLPIPFFELTKYRLVLPHLNNNLVSMVLLYEQFEQYIQTIEPNVIRCTTIPPFTEAVVLDVADAAGVPVVGADSSQSKPRTYSKLIAGNAASILDCTLAAGRNLFSEKIPEDEFVGCPRIDRFDSYESVLNSLSETPILFRPQTRATLSSTDPSSTDEHEFKALHDLATPSDVARIYQFLLWELPREMRAGTIKNQLSDYLKSELGIAMDHSIDCALSPLYKRGFLAITSTILFDRLAETTNVQTAVIGAHGVCERALINTIDDADVFYLPHTIASGYPSLPPEGVTHLVPGEPGARHIANLAYTESYDVRAVGRPTLSNLYREEFSPIFDDREAFRVLITTQPLDNHIRTTFIESILDVVGNCEHVTPSIKIHPDENSSFYQSLLDSRPEQVPVLTGGIIKEMKRSDLVVTLFSNTGIEAIAVGTPSLSFNLWSPLVRPPPYVEKGPIPYLDSEDSLAKFFETFDEETRNELITEQLEFLKDKYYIDQNPAETIASLVET